MSDYSDEIYEDADELEYEFVDEDGEPLDVRQMVAQEIGFGSYDQLVDFFQEPPDDEREYEEVDVDELRANQDIATMLREAANKAGITDQTRMVHALRLADGLMESADWRREHRDVDLAAQTKAAFERACELITPATDEIEQGRRYVERKEAERVYLDNEQRWEQGREPRQVEELKEQAVEMATEVGSLTEEQVAALKEQVGLPVEEEGEE